MRMDDAGAAEDAATTDVKARCLSWIDRNRDEAARLNDALFYFGEPSLEEYETAKLLCRVLSEAGFSVETGISGFPTAFLATIGEGAPVIALHAEYDGNPDNSQESGVTEPRPIVEGAPGHAEGHQANATVMVTAALAVAEAIKRGEVRGTLKVFGAPGEEIAASRPYFVRDGYFDDVDLALHNHIRGSFYTEVGQTQISAISAEFTFSGESAHAGLNPWDGRDALDAVVLMDMGLAQHREHMKPDMRAHRVITDGGQQPNVIPARAAVWWYFRGFSAADARALFEQACRIADGAALMTRTSVSVEIKSAVWPTRCNTVLADVLQANILSVGMPDWTEEEQAFARRLQEAAGVPAPGLDTAPKPMLGPDMPEPSSNDCGDISWVVPMGRFWFPGGVPHVRFHHWSGGAMLATSITHKGIVAGAKVLAGAICDCLADPALLNRVRTTFRAEIAGVEYAPLIPLQGTPRLGVHARLMERFRPEMAKHYRTELPRFR
ncbi:MAG: amidohydrolase [Enterovirga sp.]|nr:amidohydrolase [Enterovirga sp.]